MDKSQVDEVGAGGAQGTDSRPSGPKPRGGRGIDSATKVISRDQLPDPSTLDDLDDIDPLAGGTEADDAKAAEATDTDSSDAASSDDKGSDDKGHKPAVVKVAGTASPSATDTTVIKRDDLPDTSDMPDLDDVDITGTDSPQESGADESGGEESGAEESNDSAEKTASTEDTDSADRDGQGNAGKIAAAGAVAAGAVSYTHLTLPTKRIV